MSFHDSAHLVMERCDILARYSEEANCLTRRFATQAMHSANDMFATWLSAAGMNVHYDAIGNVIGRYEALQPGAKTLLLGSHLDTVQNAGRYDGILGVMVALVCVERLHARGERLPFAIEVMAFADEEGLRYHSAYIGSSAMTGTFDPALLHLTDINGVTMADAIQAYGGNPDPKQLSTSRWQSTDLLGYCEVHIEQGPVLEARNLPVAVVSGIAGQARIKLSFTGELGHAGTVPMLLRKDALCAAAEFVIAVEALARSQPGLVATVGQIDVQRAASNVIPGHVALSLDIRHQNDAIREQAQQILYEQARRIQDQRQLVLDWQLTQENHTVSCNPRLIHTFEQAIEATGNPVLTLSSGAGHDAVVMSKLTDVAMLFVRCAGGISHNPAEAVLEEDVSVAIAVLEHFITDLARK
ncbi:MAG: allantoate amidohydrolase [Ktedonobacteraceae bacterium]|nr:allantoate amidohydrolase [Ktedonobacteraceae bacterium]